MQLETQNQQLWENYDAISNATCWKITKPFRVVCDYLKNGSGTTEKLKGHSLKRHESEKDIDECSEKGQRDVIRFQNFDELIKDCCDNEYTVYAEERLRDGSYLPRNSVLLISHELSLTGAPIVLSFMADWFAEKGMKPVVIAERDGLLGKVYGDRGIPVIVNESINDSYFILKCAHLFSMIVVNTADCGAVAEQLNGTETPVMWWIHESRASYSNKKLLQHMPEYVKENIHVFCVSDYAEKALHEHRSTYHTRQLPYFIPDYAKLMIADCPVDIDEGKTVFICIGALEERKGQDILVEAIRYMTPQERNDSYFVFVGKINYLPIFQAIDDAHRDYPDNIVYVPTLDREAIIALYQKADCLVCPSRDDPMPTVVAEAMSMSRTIICSENTGSAALIEETGGGMVYRNNDPIELADCLSKVIRGEYDFSNMCKRARKTYEDYFSRKVFDARMERIFTVLTAKQALPVDVTVSVIIPTFNGEEYLPDLFRKLSQQADVKTIEVIVVDSGSKDDTLKIAEDFGARIIQITQAEFSHSFARNLGAKQASGEYLLFMTQDAEPTNEYWMRDLAQPILRDNAVAVSCKQEPRDDCDLLGRLSNWNHCRYIGILESDLALSMPAIGDYDSMRRNSQLDDVACMIRRDVFSRFQFRGDYAEDLDLGLRLIKAGYRLSLLADVHVIHSHNRPASYYLKRWLIDIITMKQILPVFHSENIDEDTAVNRIIGTTAAIWHYVGELTEAQNIPEERQPFFDWSRRFFDAEAQKLREFRYEDFASIIGEEIPYCDGGFYDFLQDICEHASKSFIVNTDWLDMRRNEFLTQLNDYLEYTGESFTGETIKEIAELFVKHCGQIAGETLGAYTVAHKNERSFLNDRVHELRQGV